MLRNKKLSSSEILFKLLIFDNLAIKHETLVVNRFFWDESLSKGNKDVQW